MAALNRCVIVAVLCVFVGCQPTYTKLDPHQVEGWSYVMAGATQLDGGSPAPTPDEPSGQCKTCNGTGRVGDGRVSVICQDCGGDGVVGDESKAVTIDPVTTQAISNGSQTICGPDGCITVGQGTSYSAPVYYERRGPIRRLLGR